MSVETLRALMQETPAWPDALPDHLSASSITQFMRCPEQWRRVRLAGLKERPAAALVWGSADHAAHETNFRQKIDSHEDIPVGDLQEAFCEAFQQAVERNGGKEEVDWGTDKPGELMDKGVELASTYHRIVSPRVQPHAVEERFEVEVPGSPVKVVGYVDVEADMLSPVDVQGIPDVVSARRLIERKTASRVQKQIKPEWRLQGLLYQSVKALPVDWHVSTKTKTPAVYTPLEEPGLALQASGVASKTAQRMVAVAAAQIADLYRRYGPDEPWPGAVTHPWSCQWCAWGPQDAGTCPWWQGITVAA